MNSAREAADLFQDHRDELGFVNVAQCEEKDLVVKQSAGKVVGALLGNHCVRKPQSTVYELAVAPHARRIGVAESLVDRFAEESPHDKLVAKCPADLPATAFYESTGWVKTDTDPGKTRLLNVYEYRID